MCRTSTPASNGPSAVRARNMAPSRSAPSGAELPDSDAWGDGGGSHGRARGARKLRPPRRLPRGTHPRRRRRRGCAGRSLRGRAPAVAGRRGTDQPRRLAADRRPPPTDRCRPPAADPQGRRGATEAHGRINPCRRRFPGRNPRPASRPDVRLRPSGDRARHAPAADPADHPRAERRRYRRGLPHPARNHGSAAGPRQGAHQGRRHSVPHPRPEELPERLDAVLEAIYAAYSKAWGEIGEAASTALAGEAIWLARLIVGLLPNEPEAGGMLALMLYTEARRPARRGPAGAYVPLEEQDTSLWDDSQIKEAETLLREASAGGPSGRYQIEAAIQSAHVARRLVGVDNWPAIVALYDHLLALTGSPE